MIKQELVNKLNLFFGHNDDFIDYESLVVTFEKNIEATQQDIDNITHQIKIPDDYIDFLKIFNGWTLFKHKDLGGFKFLGTNDIVKETENQRETYEEYWDDTITVFCTIICDGDFISFRNNSDGEYDILDCCHDDKPEDWKIIDRSFSSFLERLIAEKGKPYWLYE